jgi:hypothetical protein
VSQMCLDTLHDFAAPLFMSSVQFSLQWVLVRSTLGLGVVQRTDKPPVSWPDYYKIGVLARFVVHPCSDSCLPYSCAIGQSVLFNWRHATLVLYNYN